MSDNPGKMNDLDRELSDDEGSFSSSPGRAGAGKKKTLPRSASPFPAKQGPRVVKKNQGVDHAEDDTPTASNLEGVKVAAVVVPPLLDPTIEGGDVLTRRTSSSCPPRELRTRTTSRML
jgi:hypothetical protein